jgi:hypothetical protein
LLKTKEELHDLEEEPAVSEAMQVDGMEDGKCSLRKASPFWKRTGMTTCAKWQMALLTSRGCFSPKNMQCY